MWKHEFQKMWLHRNINTNKVAPSNLNRLLHCYHLRTPTAKPIPFHFQVSQKSYEISSFFLKIISSMSNSFFLMKIRSIIESIDKRSQEQNTCKINIHFHTHTKARSISSIQRRKRVLKNWWNQEKKTKKLASKSNLLEFTARIEHGFSCRESFWNYYINSSPP